METLNAKPKDRVPGLNDALSLSFSDDSADGNQSSDDKGKPVSEDTRLEQALQNLVIPGLGSVKDGTDDLEELLGKPPQRPPQPRKFGHRRVHSEGISGAMAGLSYPERRAAAMAAKANQQLRKASSTVEEHKTSVGPDSSSPLTTISTVIASVAASTPPRGSGGRGHRRSHSENFSWGSKKAQLPGGRRRAGSQDENSNPSYDWLLSVLQSRRQRYGDTHALVGEAWNRVGNHFFREGQYDLALENYKEAVKCNPGEHLAAAYANMGTVKWAVQDFREAQVFLEKALHELEFRHMSETGTVDPHNIVSAPVASALYQIGIAHTLQGSYQKATEYLQRALQMQETLSGGVRDASVARVMDAMGKVSALNGDSVAAMVQHKEALRIKQQAAMDQGGTDTGVMTSLLNIAAVHRNRREFDQAIETYERVVKLKSAEFHRRKNNKWTCQRSAKEVGETLQLLAILRLEQGREPEAEKDLQKASQIYREASVPESDPRVKAVMSRLSEVRRSISIRATTGSDDW